MSAPVDFERRLTDWLDAQAPMREPEGLTYVVLARTRRTRRMPSWANPERWRTLTVITRPELAPPMRVAWLLIIAALIAALAVGTIVGARLIVTTIQQSAFPVIAAIPQGGEAVLAFDSNGDIFTVRADGTDLRQLTSGSDIERNPAWSADGTRLAYQVWTGALGNAVVLTDAGGANPVTLLTDGKPQNDCLGDWPAAWSSDGRSLAVPTTESCDRFDLVIVPVDGSSTATRLVAPGLESINAAWSPDGKHVAFNGRDEATGTTGVYVIDIGDVDPLTGGFQARRIADGPGPNLVDAYSPLQWSADGTELAVVTGTTDTCAGSDVERTWDVVVVKADGSGQRAVASGPTDEYNPAWSRDGKQLAFHRTVDEAEYWDGRPCTVRTWVMNADGTNERQLDYLENNWPAPLWSPDGTRLVGGLIDPPTQPGESNPFHLTIFTVDGSTPPVTLGHAGNVSWQPVAAPLPAAAMSSATAP